MITKLNPVENDEISLEKSEEKKGEIEEASRSHIVGEQFFLYLDQMITRLIMRLRLCLFFSELRILRMCKEH